MAKTHSMSPLDPVVPTASITLTGAESPNSGIKSSTVLCETTLCSVSKDRPDRPKTKPSSNMDRPKVSKDRAGNSNNSNNNINNNNNNSNNFSANQHNAIPGSQALTANRQSNMTENHQSTMTFAEKVEKVMSITPDVGASQGVRKIASTNSHTVRRVRTVRANRKEKRTNTGTCQSPMYQGIQMPGGGN
jgi:hypothetical protein